MKCSKLMKHSAARHGIVFDDFKYLSTRRTRKCHRCWPFHGLPPCAQPWIMVEHVDPNVIEEKRNENNYSWPPWILFLHPWKLKKVVGWWHLGCPVGKLGDLSTERLKVTIKSPLFSHSRVMPEGIQTSSDGERRTGCFRWSIWVEKVFCFLALRMLERSLNMFKPHDVIQLVSSLKWIKRIEMTGVTVQQAFSVVWFQSLYLQTPL